MSSILSAVAYAWLLFGFGAVIFIMIVSFSRKNVSKIDCLKGMATIEFMSSVALLVIMGPISMWVVTTRDNRTTNNKNEEEKT